ncbi:MAG: Trm112 family protein, partial [Thermodesulfobacteriota bacterium]
MPIKKELLEILACPKCRGNIYADETQSWLICDACRLKYE